FTELERLGALSDAEFDFPPDLWARIVYDFAIAFHRKKMAPSHLIKSLTPLYIGKTASFILAVEPLDAAGAEVETEKLCAAFERNKDYLVSSWT
ncbi:MAG: hypothetical protein ACYC4S_08655, partial [Rhodoferax sp.]